MNLEMESFETNDGVIVKYVDTALIDLQAVKKDTLILVRLFLVHSQEVLVSQLFYSSFTYVQTCDCFFISFQTCSLV